MLNDLAKAMKALDGKKNLECGRAKSGRQDLMGSQCVARPSLERDMEAAK